MNNPPYTLPDGTVTTREDMRECTLMVFEELKREHRRAPTMNELVEITGVPVNITRAFLAVAGKYLTDSRALRR